MGRFSWFFGFFLGSVWVKGKEELRVALSFWSEQLVNGGAIYQMEKKEDGGIALRGERDVSCVKFKYEGSCLASCMTQ